MITFGGGLILEQSLFVELISREVTPAVNSIFNPKIHYRYTNSPNFPMAGAAMPPAGGVNAFVMGLP